MKHPFRSHILPYFTMGAGGLGFALRLWLFSAIDEKGLLPEKHPAGILLFILSALVLGILFLATRKLEPGGFSNLPRGSHLLSGLLGCAGMIFNALLNISGSISRLSMPAVVLSVVGGLALLWMGVMKASGKKASYWLSAVFTVALMINTIAQCQVWGSEPQIQVYFFPMMASIFLLLTAYQQTALLVRKANRPLLAFFSQAAAYFCCLSFRSTHSILYIGMCMWAAFQLSHCLPRAKEE